jgi:hypothetical protein
MADRYVYLPFHLRCHAYKIYTQERTFYSFITRYTTEESTSIFTDLQGAAKASKYWFLHHAEDYTQASEKSTMYIRENDAGEFLSHAYSRSHLFYDFLSTSDHMTLKGRLMCDSADHLGKEVR